MLKIDLLTYFSALVKILSFLKRKVMKYSVGIKLSMSKTSPLLTIIVKSTLLEKSGSDAQFVRSGITKTTFICKLVLTKFINSSLEFYFLDLIFKLRISFYDFSCWAEK